MAVLSPEDRLRSLVQADADPELTNDEIETLLYDHAVDSGYSDWAPGTVYAVGSRVVPRPGNNHVYIVTVAGTSGTAQPVFETPPFSTVTDGTVTWREDGYITSFNLNRAAAAGWRLKAAKVANRYDVDMDLHQRLERSDLIDHCLRMSETFAGKNPQSIQVAGPNTEYWLPVIGNVNSG